MNSPDIIVFLFDCDNTLLDNDCVQNDLRAHIECYLGVAALDRYWQILERLRIDLGYVDYLGALQRYRAEAPTDMKLLQITTYLLGYPFSARLYPGALEVISQYSKWGATVILSDGDVVFQPRKVQRSGLWAAVDGRVLIYIHKEQMLGDMQQRYPAQHYVMVDDKPRILTAMKSIMGEQLTTVFVRQGHYALDTNRNAAYPAADVLVDHIHDLRRYDVASLVGSSRALPTLHDRRQ